MSDCKVRIEGQYGEEEGGIYIEDSQGEVVMWDSSEWNTEPSLVFAIANAIVEALTVGTEDMRERMKTAPYEVWMEYDGEQSDMIKGGFYDKNEAIKYAKDLVETEDVEYVTYSVLDRNSDTVWESVNGKGD